MTMVYKLLVLLFQHYRCERVLFISLLMLLSQLLCREINNKRYYYNSAIRRHDKKLKIIKTVNNYSPIVDTNPKFSFA